MVYMASSKSSRPRTPTSPTSATTEPAAVEAEVGEVRLPTVPVPKKEIFRPKKSVEIAKPKTVAKPQKVFFVYLFKIILIQISQVK